jgi:hypothetical protein
MKRTTVTIVKPPPTSIEPADTARYWCPVVGDVFEKRRNGCPLNPSAAMYVGNEIAGVAYEPTCGELDTRTMYVVDNCACVVLLRL